MKTWQSAAPKRRSKSMSLKKQWHFERRFHAAGTLERTKTALRRLIGFKSTLPNERISLLNAIAQLRKIDTKLCKIESFEQFKKKKLAEERDEKFI